MTLGWDYTRLASTYDHRPNYSSALLQSTLAALGLPPGLPVAEVGAGTGKLTAELLQAGLSVVAMEPNAAMRAEALSKPALRRARWLASRGESLPLAGSSVGLVAYGSSFNVLPPQAALDECARVLAGGGAWLAVWNHRDLDDPLQHAVEQVIRRLVPAYAYGSRREDPSALVRSHGAFEEPVAAERRFTVAIRGVDWLAAWRSHATLQRQAGAQWESVLGAIAEVVGSAATLQIPYTTRLWHARRTLA
jgi:ubiquinone/menaquinone biosynthesis C-methylase UbiE